MTNLPRSTRIASILALPFTALFAAPLVFYFWNSPDIQIALTELLPYLLLSTLLGSAITGGLLLAVGYRPSLQRGVAGALIGLSAVTWIQGQLLVWNLGPLDGRGLNWEKWTYHSVAESLLWVLGLAAGAAIGVRSPRWLPKIAWAVMSAGMLSIFSALLPFGYPSKKYLQNNDAVFSFHATNNVLVILLDDFQGDIFYQIHKEHPDDTRFLDGFTYYRNTVGSYPTTYPTVPMLLTGQHYRNSEPLLEFIRNSYQSQSVPGTFEANGYATAIVPANTRIVNGLVLNRGIAKPLDRIVAESSRTLLLPALLVIDAGIFRSAPILLKRRIYSDGDWLLSRLVDRKTFPPGHHGDDLRFLNLFEHKASVRDLSSGTFKFIHIFSPHPPIRINEGLDLVAGDQLSRLDTLRQSRGALAIARRLLNKMKEIGIYASADIYILADHGSLLIPVTPGLMDAEFERVRSNAPDVVRSSGLPLLLHKPPNRSGPFELSHEEMCLSDVPQLLLARFKPSSSRPGAESRQSNRVRKFYFYDWSEEYWSWSQEYLPRIVEYEVRGDAWNPASWTRTGKEYSAPNGSTRE